MTAYFLVAFLLMQDGQVVTLGSPEMYRGADLCQANAEALTEQLEHNGSVVEFRIQCVDSKFSPGVRA